MVKQVIKTQNKRIHEGKMSEESKFNENNEGGGGTKEQR